MTERVSDERLAVLIRIASGKYAVEGWTCLPDMEAAMRELQQRRSGEWICPGCYLRQSGPKQDAGF